MGCSRNDHYLYNENDRCPHKPLGNIRDRLAGTQRSSWRSDRRLLSLFLKTPSFWKGGVILTNRSGDAVAVEAAVQVAQRSDSW